MNEEDHLMLDLGDQKNPKEITKKEKHDLSDRFGSFLNLFLLKCFNGVYIVFFFCFLTSMLAHFLCLISITQQLKSDVFSWALLCWITTIWNSFVLFQLASSKFPNRSCLSLFFPFRFYKLFLSLGSLFLSPFLNLSLSLFLYYQERIALIFCVSEMVSLVVCVPMLPYYLFCVFEANSRFLHYVKDRPGIFTFDATELLSKRECTALCQCLPFLPDLSTLVLSYSHQLVWSSLTQFKTKRKLPVVSLEFHLVGGPVDVRILRPLSLIEAWDFETRFRDVEAFFLDTKNNHIFFASMLEIHRISKRICCCLFVCLSKRCKTRINNINLDLL